MKGVHVKDAFFHAAFVKLQKKIYRIASIACEHSKEVL
jgi:hypothetical protein